MDMKSESTCNLMHRIDNNLQMDAPLEQTADAHPADAPPEQIADKHQVAIDDEVLTDHKLIAHIWYHKRDYTNLSPQS